MYVRLYDDFHQIRLFPIGLEIALYIRCYLILEVAPLNDVNTLHNSTKT